MTEKKKTKSEVADAAKKSATINKAEAVNLEFSLESLTKTSLSINEMLANLGKDLIAKTEELDSIEDAIKFKKEEMKELHGADKVLLSISELEAERVRIDAENEQYRADKEIERQREQAQYDYTASQLRKKDADTWAEQVRVRGNLERDKTETFEKDLKIRTEILQAKEQDYNAALEKVKTFDDVVAKEVKAAVGRELGMAQARFDADKRLNDVTHKADVDGLKKDIEHRDVIIVAKNVEINSLKEQLSKALEAQTALAKATVDAASNKTAQAEAMATFTNIAGGNGARGTARG